MKRKEKEEIGRDFLMRFEIKINNTMFIFVKKKNICKNNIQFLCIEKEESVLLVSIEETKVNEETAKN